MASTPILALDLGKYKCVSCTHDRVTAAAEFRTVTTSRAEVERLVRTTAPAVVVIEACTPAGWVADLCGDLGIPVKGANTAAEAWKYKHAKRKTDQDDALRLAQLEALGQLPTVVVPQNGVREWRALIAHRQGLVAQRVAAQNRIRAVLVGQGLLAPRGAKAWTAAGLAGMPRSKYQPGRAMKERRSATSSASKGCLFGSMANVADREAGRPVARLAVSPTMPSSPSDHSAWPDEGRGEVQSAGPVSRRE